MTANWLKIGAGGVVPVQWFDTATKAGDGGPGTLSGYASVFNNVDDQDEVVAPGAFKNTIARWKQAGRRIPLMDGHSMRNEDVIGSFDVTKEDVIGLAVKATFSSDPKSQALRQKSIEKHVNGLSIFGEVKKFATRTMGEKTIRILEEVHLLHVGLVAMPANMLAGATAKSLVAVLGEQWVEDMRAALSIKEVGVRDAAVAALIAKQYTIATPEAPKADGAPSDDDDVSKDDSADYALTLIGNKKSGPGTDPSGSDPSDSGQSVADLLKSVEGAQAAMDLEGLFKEMEGQ